MTISGSKSLHDRFFICPRHKKNTGRVAHYDGSRAVTPEAISPVIPHTPPRRRRVWAWPGLPGPEPGPRHPAGSLSPEPACERPPTSAADTPPSAT